MFFYLARAITCKHMGSILCAHKCTCSVFKAGLKMAAWAAETCRRALVNFIVTYHYKSLLCLDVNIRVYTVQYCHKTGWHPLSELSYICSGFVFRNRRLIVCIMMWIFTEVLEVKKTVKGRMSEVSERHVKKRSQESPETTSACFGQKWPPLEYWTRWSWTHCCQKYCSVLMG